MIYDLNISVVSHQHGTLVVQALQSLAESLSGSGLLVRVLLTLNLPEPAIERELHANQWPFALNIIHNPSPLGFGANHNQAFACADAPWFAVVNPDIVWPSTDASFWMSLRTCRSCWDARIGLLCPEQVDTTGQRQDFARELLTPWGLVDRAWRRWRGKAAGGVAPTVRQADWVNGACMVFRSQAFAGVGGFDLRYFMYCEDIDICLRLRLAGWDIHGTSWAVVHDARRNTHRSGYHLIWHLRSILRLWMSVVFWRYWMVFRHRGG